MTDTSEDGARTAPNRKNFTAAWLLKLKHPEAGQIVVWDEKQPGLSVLISGKVASFRVTFSLGGKFISTKLGRVTELPLGEARTMANEYRSRAVKGEDPRKAKPSALTYAEVCDRFVARYCRPRQRTWRQTEGHLKRTCAPWLKRPFHEITKQDAKALLQSFIDDGNVYKASVCRSWLKKLWRWAAEEDIVASGIMSSLKIEFEKRVRDRVYSDQEIAAIWHAADQLNPERGAFFKLLVLMVPRKGALAAMRWEDVKGDLWTTPHEHTKTKKTAKPRTYLTPLPGLAMRILSGLPRTSERVFPHLPTRPEILPAKQLIAKGAPEDWGYHTCRHTAASWFQSQGHSEYEVSLILNHASSSVTSGYQHSYPLQLKRQLLEKWASHIGKLIQPEHGVTLLR